MRGEIGGVFAGAAAAWRAGRELLAALRGGGGILRFKLKEGRPFEAACGVHGWPGAEFEAVFSTRSPCVGIIPAALLPEAVRNGLLAPPPAGRDDPVVVAEDVLLGRMECVERTLAIDVHADNGTWTSAELPFLLSLGGGPGKALVGNGFMAAQWRGLSLAAGFAVVSVKAGPAGLRPPERKHEKGG